MKDPLKSLLPPNNVSMAHGEPTSPLPMVGILPTTEEYPQEPHVGGVPPTDLGSSCTSPIADALANLPWLSKTTVTLVELYDMLNKSGCLLKMFDLVVQFI
jgi:hypothetical protein